MRIAFFVHGYLPWDIYGVPRYIERLSNYLSHRGHNVYIITIGRPNNLKIEKPTSYLTIYRIFFVNPFFKNFTSFWSWAFYTFGCIVEGLYFVKKEKIQIMHGHTIEWGGLQAALMSRITHKPLIITLHGSALSSLPNKFPKHYSFLRWADVIICQKKSAQKKLLQWGFPQKKVILLPQGCVDSNKYVPCQFKCEKSTPVVTFVGRLIPFKGPHLLIDAIPYILTKCPNVSFNFVGEGPMKKQLETKAELLNILDNVHFLGFRFDVDNLLRHSDVFVSLSPFENVSDLSLLEALSTGVPIVATDSGETNSIIKHKETGLLVKCDPKDIADKVLMVLTDSKLAECLSKNGRELVLKKHCLDISAKREEDLYLSFV